MPIKASVKSNIGYVGSKLVEKCGSLQKAFQFFDNDRDQEINKQEFLKGMEALQIMTPRHELMELFEHMDFD